MKLSTFTETLRRSGILMILSLVIAGGIAVAIFFSVTAATSDQEDVPDWPPFTMTYQESGHFHGLAEPMSTRTYRVDYQSRSDWTKELISSTVDPREVGTTYRLNDGSFKITSSDTQEPILTDEADVAAPNWWLVPTRDLILESEEGFQRVDSSSEEPNQVVYEKVERISCAASPSEEFDAVTQPAVCHDQADYEYRESIVYRTDITPAVPIRITTIISGELASEIRATEFMVLDH